MDTLSSYTKRVGVFIWQGGVELSFHGEQYRFFDEFKTYGMDG